MKTRLSSAVKSRRDCQSKVTIRRKMASLRVCLQRRQLRRAATSLTEQLNDTVCTRGSTGIGTDRGSPDTRIDEVSGRKVESGPDEIGGRRSSGQTELTE